MVNKLSYSKTFWSCLVAGMLTGMGNGSVFGAAMMNTLGRGRFDNWGGWGAQAYDPTTFQGFITWMMLIFGVAFTLNMLISFKRHGELEAVES